MRFNTEITVKEYESTDSTSTRAREYLKENPNCERALFIAGTQTTGRGRQGKTFYSPGGTGVYFTYIYRADDDADVIHVTAKTAVAVVTVLERLCGRRLQIKWVNDIYLRGKKVCGILCERVGRHILIGIGINLTTDGFPSDISSRAGALGIECDRDAIIIPIVRMLFGVRDMDWYEFYKSRSLVLAREIVYYKNGEEFYGVAEDIDRDGGLIVRRADGSLVVLNSGEITVRQKI